MVTSGAHGCARQCAGFTPAPRPSSKVLPPRREGPGALAFAGSLAPRVFEVAARVDVVATEGWGRTLDLGHLIEKGVWYLDLG